MQKIVIPEVKKPEIDQGIVIDSSLLNNSRPIIKPIETEEKPQIEMKNTIEVKDETSNEIEIPEEPQPEKIEEDEDQEKILFQLKNRSKNQKEEEEDQEKILFQKIMKRKRIMKLKMLIYLI